MLRNSTIYQESHAHTRMDYLADLDEATLQVIIQGQLQDLEEMARANAPKGKGRAGQHDPCDDLSVAINTYRDELAARSQLLADEAMCRSMASAVDTDAEQIQALMFEEQRSARDRRMAFQMQGQPVPEGHGNGHTSGAAAEAVDDEVVERLRHLNLSSSPLMSPTSSLFSQSQQTEADDPVNNPESSSWAAQRRPAHRTMAPLRPAIKKPTTRECIACTDRHIIDNLIRSPACGHEYCRDCIQSLFTSSLTDESLFPPRCCGQAIPLDSCRTHLTATLTGQFQAKKRELDTPNRTYCHRPTCSAWVPPESIRGQVARCIKCYHGTCVLCKGARHIGRDCPDDPATQQVLQLAQEQGWQRCRACQKFVELNTGCNHISEFSISRYSIYPQLTATPPPPSLPLRLTILLRLRPALEDLRLRTVGRTHVTRAGQRGRGPQRGRTAAGRASTSQLGGAGAGVSRGEPRVRAYVVEVAGWDPSVRGVQPYAAELYL